VSSRERQPVPVPSLGGACAHAPPPRQVYAELAEDGYDVEYLRVPVTDEKAPKERDFAELQARAWGRLLAPQARGRLRMRAPPARMHTRAAEEGVTGHRRK